MSQIQTKVHIGPDLNLDGLGSTRERRPFREWIYAVNDIGAVGCHRRAPDGKRE